MAISNGELHEQVTKLGRVLGIPRDSMRSMSWNEAWEQCCQTSSGNAGNLLWRYGRQVIGSGNEDDMRQCQATLGTFLDSPLRDAVQRHKPGTTCQLLDGIVHSVQAAAARRLDSSKDEDHLALAAKSFQSVFQLDDKQPVDGLMIAERAMHDLLGELRVKFVSRTWILPTGPVGKAFRVVAELEPGPSDAFLPNVGRIGCIELKTGFLRSVQAALQFVQDRWPCPAGHRVVWGFEEHHGVNIVDGSSGGAALAAVFRGATEGSEISTFVAVSATLDAVGGLGKVEGGDEKRKAAMDVSCDEVLFHSNTVCDRNRVMHQGSRLPKVTPVTTFDQAWPLLSEMERCIRIYKEHWRSEWAKEWPISVNE